MDGLLLVPTLTGIDDPAVRAGELMALPVPRSWWNSRLIGSGPGDRTEHVCSDHLGGAYDAVLHLHRLGHRRIALITRSRNPTGVAVALGFQRAMSDLGLPPGFSHEAEKAEWTPGLADRMIGDLTTSGTTAALVFGDREAILLEAAARRHGTDIPGQLALVSYDDETADIAEVPLTAVAPPKYRVGRMAAEVLLRRPPRATPALCTRCCCARASSSAPPAARRWPARVRERAPRGRQTHRQGDPCASD